MAIVVCIHTLGWGKPSIIAFRQTCSEEYYLNGFRMMKHTKMNAQPDDSVCLGHKLALC